MTDLIPVKTPGKRRRFSTEFKARILAACEQPGTSVASVALANELNANLIHKWRRLAKDNAPGDVPVPDFLPITHTRPTGSIPLSTHVMIEAHEIKVHWPLEHIDRAIPWLHALQS